MPGNPGSDLGYFTSRSASQLNKVLFNITKFNKNGKINTLWHKACNFI